MFFIALEASYEKILAVHGLVCKASGEPLKALKGSGRRSFLILGR
jgi:hypothetical protein